MAKVTGKDTKPEIIVRKFLFAHGFRYRLNDSRYPGRPDIVLPKHRTVVFVNGCFWHGHTGCKASALPKTNSEFWRDKINDNVLRDRKNTLQMKALGWKVITIWLCEIKNKNNRNNRLYELVDQISS